MSSSANALAFAGRRISRDRLVTTLIFALLAHGLILFGVGFAALAPRHASGPSVEVTLVRSASDKPPEQARYRAQVDARGPGNARRAASAEPASASANPFPDPTMALANALAANLPGLAAVRNPISADEAQARNPLVTTTAPARLEADGETPLPANARPLLLARLSAAPEAAGVLSDSPVRLPQVLAGSHPEKNAQTVDAIAAEFAPYLEAWRRRIEAIGSAQFAQLVPAKISHGHLTLAVSLNADGSIRSVQIEQRSRYPELDAAALEIIRLAAPFPPFPASLQGRTKTLDFAYRWNFIRGQGTTGTVGLGGG